MRFLIRSNPELLVWVEDYSGLYEVTVAHTDRTTYCSYTTLTLNFLIALMNTFQNLPHECSAPGH